MVTRLIVVMALATTLATPVKWGKHKKSHPPLIIPDAPFSIEPDPREVQVHQYLQKKLEQLEDDRKSYPELKEQITSLIDDIAELEDLPVSGPDYAAKFAAFHASLVSLWTLESYDSI